MNKSVLNIALTERESFINLGRKYMGSSEAAEDAYQSFLAKILQKPLNVESNFRGFTYKAFHNFCLNSRRSETRTLNRIERFKHEPVDSVFQDLSKLEIEQIVKRANIPNVRKKVLNLVLKDYRIVDMSKELKCAYDTAKSNYYFLLEDLRAIN